VCESVDMKVYVCDESSEVTVMLTSGDRVMDDGEGVGPSVAIMQAKQSKHKASGISATSYTRYESDDITVLDCLVDIPIQKPLFTHNQT
jgi:hypothetical protein